MVMSVNIMKDKSTVAPAQYPRSLSKAQEGSSVMSKTPSIPLLNKYRRHSLMLSLSLEMLSSSFESKAKEGLDNGRIAVVCRKNLPKVGFHPLDKFERRASSQGSNDRNLFSLVILSQTLEVDAHVL